MFDFELEFEEEVFEKNKKRAIRRKNDIKKALRKQQIANNVFDVGRYYYDNLHQYSKNKIHCSCAMCSEKTTVKKFMAVPNEKFDMWKNPPVCDYENNHIVTLLEGIPNNNITKGVGQTYHRKGKNWSISDIKKIENCESQLAEFYSNDPNN